MSDFDVSPAVDVLRSVDVDVSGEGFEKTPFRAPRPDLTGPRRRMRRPRAEFIRDVRRLITVSWLAKTGQRWRWTPIDRDYLYRLTMATSAWDVMAAWDCYLTRPWQGCYITHFCSETVQQQLRDDSRFKSLAVMYRDRLISKSRRVIRQLL